MSLLLFFSSSGGGGGPECTPTEPPTGDALKLETGDHLLLESCDHLLLETINPSRTFPGYLQSLTQFRVPQFLIQQKPGWLGHVRHTEEPGVRVPQSWLQSLAPRRTPDLTFLNRPFGWQGHPGLGPFWDASGNIFCGDSTWVSSNISGICTTAWSATGIAVNCATGWDNTANPSFDLWRAQTIVIENTWLGDDTPECPSTRT